MKTTLYLSLLVLGLWLTPGARGDDRATMDKLQTNISDLRKELQKVQGVRSNVQQELQKSEAEMSSLQRRVSDIQQDLSHQHQQLADLNLTRQRLEQSRIKQQAQAAAQVRAAYLLGQQPQVKVFLNQESPEKMARMMQYHRYFMTAHADKIKSFLATMAELNDLEPQIAQKTAELNQIKQDLSSEQAHLQEIQAERKQTLVSINGTISSKDKELQRLQEDRRQLQALLQKVTRTASNLAAAPSYVPLPKLGEKFSARKGLLPWPTQGRIAHGFGSSQVEGQMQWNGVLIASNSGQPVQAVHYGRVIFADFFRGQGLLVIIDHGEGYLTLYAHNQLLYKKPGDTVKAGEAIATVGSSGGQNSDALYFEIRFQGKAIDPLAWLARV